MTVTNGAGTEAGYAKAYNVPDPRAAKPDDVRATMRAIEAQRRIHALIEELEAASRLAVREMESEATWIRRMQDQTAAHLDVLMQMRTTLDAIQSWIGGDTGC